MIVSIIILAINLAIGAFVFYRFGRQSAYNDLLKAYTLVCKQRDKAFEMVDYLDSVLKGDCNNKKTEEEKNYE